MKQIFFAGCDRLPLTIIKSAKNVLFNYYYVSGRFSKIRDKLKDNIVFMDSGAFTAITKGAEIDIGKYCSFLNENIEYIHEIICLDAIGNREKTKENYLFMRKNLIQPEKLWFVWHYGSTGDGLFKDIVDLGITKLAIGGMVFRTKKERMLSLQNILHRFPEGVKVHLLGVCDVEIVRMFDITSFDSSTWQVWANNGYIATEKERVRVKDNPDCKYFNMFGFDRKSLLNYNNRRLYNILYFEALNYETNKSFYYGDLLI